jgi:hypothetical protein
MNRRTATRLAALVASVLVALAAQGGPAVKPTVVDPLPFDHAQHAPELERLGLGCVTCHGFAAAAETAPDAAVADDQPTAPVNPAVCHGCHRPEIRGLTPAPSSCALCHPVVAELRPGDHGPDWMQAHAAAGRSVLASCTDCHERAVCVDCHEARGALARDPHPPAFRAVHGLEARLDPASCDTCHTGESCRSCHEGGGVPW